MCHRYPTKDGGKERRDRSVATNAIRIGINQGDIVFDETRVYGDGVNVAARLESIAEPSGIRISGKVFEEVQGRISVGYTDLGPQQLKNIPQPVRVYRLDQHGASPTGEHARLAIQTTCAMNDKPSIAVLPFTNLSGEAEQDYFADGIVEDIVTALSRLRWLFVIARNSSHSYRDRRVDVKEVGRDLGVKYVVEGTTRKAGSRVRITTQLIDTKSSAHLWADRYDREFSDIFAIQDELTTRIVGTLAPEVTAAEIARTIRLAQATSVPGTLTCAHCRYCDSIRKPPIKKLLGCLMRQSLYRRTSPLHTQDCPRAERRPRTIAGMGQATRRFLKL